MGTQELFRIKFIPHLRLRAASLPEEWKAPKEQLPTVWDAVPLEDIQSMWKDEVLGKMVKDSKEAKEAENLEITADGVVSYLVSDC